MKNIKNFLFNTGEVTKKIYKNKYVVIDVETNGLNACEHDLLSLSIFDLFTGIAYNRYFPLDLQFVVLTSFKNGITKDMLIKNNI